jgi:hypothetical protein
VREDRSRQSNLFAAMFTKSGRLSNPDADARDATLRGRQCSQQGPAQYRRVQIGGSTFAPRSIRAVRFIRVNRRKWLAAWRLAREAGIRPSLAI